MPQRWVLSKLSQSNFVKVENVDLKAEVDNEKFIQTSSEMFDKNKERGTTSILQAMKPCQKSYQYQFFLT